ncbi:MAG: hypothetical protein EXR52_07565 [Dehalococcoidia bacterium]|nr:hypothetical protein [Dehalococcoidia bacterium]
MPTSISFLVDENLPLDVAVALRDAGHDVLYVREGEYRGASDEVLWDLAAIQRRILITRDLDFPLRRSPAPAGVILLRVPDTYRRSQIGEVVRNLLAAHDLDQMLGAVTVVRPGYTPRARPIKG